MIRIHGTTPVRYALLRPAATLLMFLACASSVCAQQKGEAVLKPLAAEGQVTLAEMNERIEEATVEYERDAPVARAGFFDVAHPSTVEEYLELAGNAVVLVTLLVQDKSEIPVKRAYIALSGGREIELRLIASVQSKQTEVSARVAKTFGAQRMDALYLLPVYLGFNEANLMVDFAKGKGGFRLGTLSGSGLWMKEKMPATTLAEYPSETALKQFVEREYPGFLKK